MASSVTAAAVANAAADAASPTGGNFKSLRFFLGDVRDKERMQFATKDVIVTFGNTPDGRIALNKLNEQIARDMGIKDLQTVNTPIEGSDNLYL